MARYRLKRYFGVVFIGVVVIPAVILSFLAMRAISHEEAYIEKQIEGTLRAEVTHAAAVVRSELTGIQVELVGTLPLPVGDDPSGPFEEWRRSSALVDIPFLLSPTYEVLWPTAGPSVGRGSGPADARRTAGDAGTVVDEAEENKQATFLASQEAFLSDKEKTPVYENIAVLYKDDILAVEPSRTGASAGLRGTAAEPPTKAGKVSGPGGPAAERTGGAAPPPVDRSAETGARPEGTLSAVGKSGVTQGRPSYRVSRGPDRGAAAAPGEVSGETLEVGGAQLDTARGEAALGTEVERQSAISRFVQSESIRSKVYDKAEREGQKVLYRNVETAEAEAPSQASEAPDRAGQKGAPTQSRLAGIRGDAGVTGVPSEDAVAPQPAPETEAGVTEGRPDETSARSGPRGWIRSMFISEPLSFSEIVAGGDHGIVPRMVGGSLQLLYWQKSKDGRIVGCLIDSHRVRERIVGALPVIYSPVRILTVLDESGRPLIVPPGTEDRDWRKPFVAEEIGETLPRWEIAAYLTDPDLISSRAQVATSVMWILILILFVSIVGGGVLVVRSTLAEVRLAQQKTTFVANVSHELKTPLTSIRMFAEMLRDGRQPDRDKQKQYLEIMTAETERLTRLVNNVLDFSRMERGEKRYTMRAVDLAALASGVVESQRTRLEHNGFEVSFAGGTGPVTVKADEEALKQALVNLLSNAEKYSTDIRQIDVAVTQDDGTAVVSVSDRGVGVPAAEARMIFEEFYRVDDALTSKVKGAGLGLTIARRILKDHGGDIRLRCREGGGSTFEIVLPAAGGTT